MNRSNENASDALRTRIKEADLANEAETDLVHQGREAVLRVTLAYAESIVDTVQNLSWCWIRIFT